MQDIMVSDEEYKALSTKYIEIKSLFDHQILEYEKIMDQVKEKEIADGKIHKNLETFIESYKSSLELLGNTLDQISKLCNEYITEIDKSDSFMY